MFVAQDLTVDVGSRVAQARFTNLLRGAWFTEASEAAYDGGLTGLLRVGPAGPVTAKLVRVRVLDPVYRGDVMTVGLRWEATGPAGSLFPILDADIRFSPVGEEGTDAAEQSARLALAGAYRPLLGRLGGRTRPGCPAPGRHNDDAHTAAQRCQNDHQPCQRRTVGRGNQP